MTKRRQLLTTVQWNLQGNGEQYLRLFTYSCYTKKSRNSFVAFEDWQLLQSSTCHIHCLHCPWSSVPSNAASTTNKQTNYFPIPCEKKFHPYNKRGSIKSIPLHLLCLLCLLHDLISLIQGRTIIYIFVLRNVSIPMKKVVDMGTYDVHYQLYSPRMHRLL